jgi:hypothetical protein
VVRSIFQRFLKLGSATTLAQQLIAENVRNKYNKPIDKGMLYKMLNNPVYVGIAMHKGVSHPGEHVGIIDRNIWDRVQAKFQASPRKRGAATRAQMPSLLKGIIFGPTGIAMSPTHTRKNGRLYRYYLSQTVLKQGSGEAMLSELQPLVDKVWRHCEDKGTLGRTVTLKVKFADFELISRSRSVAGSVDSRSELESVSAELLKALFPMKKAVRLLGVSISGFHDGEIERSEQIALEL